MNPSIGIDLGTTNTVVAHVGHPLAPKGGVPTLPSVIAFPPDAPMLIGARARRRLTIDPENTVASAKRLIGEPFAVTLQRRLQPRFGPELVHSRDGTIAFRTRAGIIDPVRVGAHLAAFACERVGRCPKDITNAVVTVPAGFDARRRRATLAAARAAGLRSAGLVDEPIATAVAYLHRSSLRYAVVYDLGGGTFDVAVIDCSKPPFKVLAHGGDPFLGGDDVDRALAEHVADRVLREHGWDLRSEHVAFRRLVAACELAKCALKDQEHVSLPIGEIDEAAPPGLPPVVIDRALLDATIEPIVGRTLRFCDEVLAEARLNPQDVEAVFLAGGSAHLKGLHDRVQRYFNKRPRTDIDPLHVVSIGASYAAVRPDLAGLLDTPIGRRPQSRPGMPRP